MKKNIATEEKQKKIYRKEKERMEQAKSENFMREPFHNHRPERTWNISLARENSKRNSAHDNKLT